MDVVRSNLRSGVEATAYFYTEIEDFSQYERAVKGDTTGAGHDAPGGEARSRRGGEGQ